MAFCAECPHCAAVGFARADSPDPKPSDLRPWEFVHYGSKITGVVDWYDGWWIGVRATDRSEGKRAPQQIIDKRQWLSGFIEGWQDGEARRMRQQTAWWLRMRGV